VQVLGTFFAAQLAAKEMQKQETPGSIVLIASISSHIALPGYKMAAYNASKGGVRILSTALAVELAPKRIRVNSISPGFIDSEQTRVIRDLKSVNESAVMDTAPPLKRIGTQNDLTGAVVYLLSDASSYTTAADIPITGGLHAGRMEM
jgi:sorbose reductase